MTIEVTKDDVAKVLANIQAMTGKELLVGIPAEKTARKGEPITNASLGYIHENGSPARNIPARPFLVPGVKKATPKAIAAMKQLAGEALLDRNATDKALNAAGLVCQAQVKRQIVSQDGFTALKAGTIAARRRSGAKGTKALIRTGQLLNSITYVVREKK